MKDAAPQLIVRSQKPDVIHAGSDMRLPMTPQARAPTGIEKKTLLSIVARAGGAAPPWRRSFATDVIRLLRMLVLMVAR